MKMASLIPVSPTGERFPTGRANIISPGDYIHVITACYYGYATALCLQFGGCWSDCGYRNASLETTLGVDLLKISGRKLDTNNRL